MNGKRNLLGALGLLGYKVIKPIGKGRFGTCYIVEKERGIQVAKIFDAKYVKARQEKINKEIKILKKITLQSTPKYIETIKVDGIFGYVMEKKEGVTLENIFECFEVDFSKKEVFNIIYSLSTILTELHKKKVVHRDVKSSNVIFNPKLPEDLSLIDFGSAHLNSEKIETDFMGLGQTFLELAANSYELCGKQEKLSLQNLKINREEKECFDKLLLIKNPYSSMEEFKNVFLKLCMR
ncbi:MAG: protein kinase domain-containing protein [Eubacteriaceae bacterium]